MWIDVTNDKVYQCVDATEGAAVWEELTGSAGGVPNGWHNVMDYGAAGDGVTDDTAAIQDAVDACTDGGTVYFPPGTYLVNSDEESDIPVTVQVHNVTMLGAGVGSILLKSVADRTLITVGESESPVSEGTRIQGFQCIGLAFDGNGEDDTADDYSMLNLKYVDDGLVSGCTFFDGGVGVRIGHGELTWSLTNQRSRWCRVEKCHFRNMEYFGIELHGAYNCTVSGNTIEGGAASANSTNLGIRFVKCYGLTISGNVISACGGGIGASTGSGEDQVGIVVSNNVIIGSTHSVAMKTSGPITGLSITANIFRGSGLAYTILLDASGLGDLKDLIIANNEITALAATELSLLRIDQAERVTITGNTLRHVGMDPGATVRAIRLVDCDGLCVVQSNVIDVGGSGSDYRGIEDYSGESGLDIICKDNVIYMSGTPPFTYGIYQTSSSGTMVTEAGEVDSNIYVAR